MGGILPQRQRKKKERRSQRSASRQATDGRISRTGAVRGAEHRRGRRNKPAGARARRARVGCQHRDVLSDDPAAAEKRSAMETTKELLDARNRPESQRAAEIAALVAAKHACEKELAKRGGACAADADSGTLP